MPDICQSFDLKFCLKNVCVYYYGMQYKTLSCSAWQSLDCIIKAGSYVIELMFPLYFTYNCKDLDFVVKILP